NAGATTRAPPLVARGVLRPEGPSRHSASGAGGAGRSAGLWAPAPRVGRGEGIVVLSVRDAYQRWAPHYDTETAVTILENEMVAGLGVMVEGRRVLDAGCGTGRRLRHTTAALAVGVDLSYHMLAQARCASALAVAD